MRIFLKKKKDEETFTEFGENSVIEGELKSKNSIKIKGKFRGTINSEKEVIFSESATFTGTTKASSVTISGKFEGSIETLLLILKNGSSLKGEISTSKLKVECGSFINVKISQK